MDTGHIFRAATRATCIGADNGRTKRDSRLGSQWAEGTAATWQTFATAFVKRDGSGYIEVRRGNDEIHIRFGPEDGPLPTINSQILDSFIK